MMPAAARAAPRNGSAPVTVRRWAQAVHRRRRPSKTGAGRAPQFSQVEVIALLYRWAPARFQGCARNVALKVTVTLTFD